MKTHSPVLFVLFATSLFILLQGNRNINGSHIPKLKSSLRLSINNYVHLKSDISSRSKAIQNINNDITYYEYIVDYVVEMNFKSIVQVCYYLTEPIGY